jgi:hypothetical protein
MNFIANGLVMKSKTIDPTTNRIIWSHTGPPKKAHINAIKAPPANQIVVSEEVANSTNNSIAIAISQIYIILSDTFTTSSYNQVVFIENPRFSTWYISLRRASVMDIS